MDTLGKIRRHHWKERYKIDKIAKFESDLLKTYEDIAPQTFVWWGGGGPHRGAPPPPSPPHTNVCNFSTLRSCIFISFQKITFKFGNFINFVALFSVVFPNVSMSKFGWKKLSWRGNLTSNQRATWRKITKVKDPNKKTERNREMVWQLFRKNLQLF